MLKRYPEPATWGEHVPRWKATRSAEVQFRLRRPRFGSLSVLYPLPSYHYRNTLTAVISGRRDGATRGAIAARELTAFGGRIRGGGLGVGICGVEVVVGGGARGLRGGGPK